MIIHLKTKYLDEDAEVAFAKYPYSQKVAIRLNSLRSWAAPLGEPLAVASVNIEGPLEPREIAIKDYSEGEGMLAALIAAGIVEDTGVALASGYVSTPIARLTDTALTEAKRQGVVITE